MPRRLLTPIGLVVAGGAGYYLYNAGGDPKVAEKQLEADASKASAKIQNKLPGRIDEAEYRGEAAARQAGNKFDQAAADAQKKLQQGKADAEAKYQQGKAEAQRKYEEGKKEAHNLAQSAAAETNKAIDKFDQTVTEGAAKAKSGISSWFGGK